MSNRKTSETNKTHFEAQGEGEIQMRLLKITSMQQDKTGARTQVNFSSKNEVLPWVEKYQKQVRDEKNQKTLGTKNPKEGT